MTTPSPRSKAPQSKKQRVSYTADQLSYLLWRMSGERLPVRESFAVIEATLNAHYRRGYRTAARKYQRNPLSKQRKRKS